VKRGQTFVVYSEVIDQLAVLARAAGIAAKAAPYFHSRLQAIEHTGERERERERGRFRPLSWWSLCRP
jgi:hypothetical protein